MWRDAGVFQDRNSKLVYWMMIQYVSVLLIQSHCRYQFTVYLILWQYRSTAGQQRPNHQYWGEEPSKSLTACDWKQMVGMIDHSFPFGARLIYLIFRGQFFVWGEGMEKRGEYFDEKVDESRSVCIVFTATETQRAEVFSWVYLYTMCLRSRWIIVTSHKRKVVFF